jgi:16S rRNA (cytosine967-C5)-methyltransferase
MVPELLQAEPGMRVFDLCAAPGTKTQETACMMKNRGEIIAMDLYPERVGLIGQLMEKTGVSIVKTIAGDASLIDDSFPEESFDRVLADVRARGSAIFRTSPRSASA